MNTVLVVLYLHDVHSHARRGHALHVVHQPVYDLGADEAVERQPLLLRQQLHARPVVAPGTDTAQSTSRAAKSRKWKEEVRHHAGSHVGCLTASRISSSVEEEDKDTAPDADGPL